MTRDDMLRAMGEALAQEARAARNFAAKTSRSASRGRGRAIRNAKLTLHLNGERLYTVVLDHTWQQPEDTFVRVTMPDSAPIEAYVEFVIQGTGSAGEGPRVSNLVVTTEKDLPRQLPAGARVEPAPDLLHTRLCEALRDPKEGQRCLASKAFGLLPVEETPSVPSIETPGFRPGQAQQRAVDMALRHDVLYVIGPPGTGKTVTLASMAYQFIRQGLTVLIAAQTNIAVDNAIEQLAALCDQSRDQVPLESGLIIRLGQPYLASVRRRKEFSLPALATDSLLEKMRPTLCSLQQQQVTLEERRDQLIPALTKLGKERMRARDAVETAQKMSVFARAFARVSRKQAGAALVALEEQIAERENEQAALLLELNNLVESHQAASRSVSHLEQRAKILSKARASADDAIVSSEDEIAGELTRDLFEEEKRVLASTQVVGATLTKTYVSKALKDENGPRRFDVVIVDEASMASLPALFVAAARADRHVVFIGDPRQLPPIVKSRREAQIAQTWLGRDIFEHVGVTLEDAAAGRQHSALLDEQRRMHPAISRVPGHLIYEDLLRDHPSVSDMPSALEPLPDQPLVLCDTSQASPQCSKLQSSRLNAYHAICTFVLGRRALDSLKRFDSGGHADDGFRVGLITPYRRQADLLQRMIEREGLQREMRAGTVHRFQGLECDAVVYDTVDSHGVDPTSFTKNDHTKQARRLINVALTRARRKLIIVANRQYLEDTLATVTAQGDLVGDGKVSSEHTLLKVIREVRGEAIVDSLEFVRTAVSDVPRTVRTGIDGTIDQALQRDLHRARQSVIIVSPFVTNGRTAAILAMLRPALDRKAAVHVVTRPSSAIPSDVVSSEALAALQACGVACHTGDTGLHEKLVFIDKNVVYVGSMNTLSFGGSTQEVMVRVTDAKIIRDLRAPYEQLLANPS